MTCPYCGFMGPRRALHAHLAEAHADAVACRAEPTGHMYFALRCPRCASTYEREVNPQGRDPHFLDTYRGEINLVAFDMLLYHLEAEHGADEAAPVPETKDGAAQ